MKLSLFLLLALLAVPSQAGVITTYSTLGDWTVALNQPATTLDLSSYSGTPPPVVVADFTFDGQNIILSGGIVSSTGAITITIAPTTFLNALAFNWTAPLNGGSQTATISVTTSTNQTFNVNAVTSATTSFWGALTTDQITSITFSVPLQGGATLALDTVQYADTAPEPPGLWLLGAPVAVMLRLKRRS